MVVRAKRTDANHAAIRDGLRKAGVWVTDLSGLGNGVPDLLCCNVKEFVLLEVKDGSKPPSARKPTPLEQVFLETAWNRQAPVFVVTSLDEAMAAVRLPAAWGVGEPDPILGGAP